MAKLVSCLVRLRSDLDEMFPGRPHISDGWIGDAAHAARRSDHNPDKDGWVHAIDVTAAPWLAGAVEFLVERCRAGEEQRLTYVIYQGTIWAASAGWQGQDYDGADQHNQHAHFSAGTKSAQNNSSWHLEDIPVALTDSDKDWVRKTLTEVVDARFTKATKQTPFKTGGGAGSEIGAAVLNHGYPAHEGADRTPAWQNLQGLSKPQENPQQPATPQKAEPTKQTAEPVKPAPQAPAKK